MSDDEKLSTYDLCHYVMKQCARCAAEIFTYERWGAEFSYTRLQELPGNLKAQIEGQTDGKMIDPGDLTAEQMAQLGFGTWSEENPIRLIPLYLVPFLKDEFEAGCLDDKPVMTKTSEMDNDHRFGCIAHGVMPRKVTA